MQVPNNAEKNPCVVCVRIRLADDISLQVLRSDVTARAKVSMGEISGWFEPGLEPEKQLVSGAFAAGVMCILCLDQFTAGCGGTV